MNVPIRMLGIAISLFWIILVAFIVSAVYSITGSNFRFGEPQFTVTPNRELRFSLPLHIDNRGYYSLESLNVTTLFSDAEGSEISKTSTFVPTIPQGQNVTICHNATLSIDTLVEKADQYLFNDNSLTASVTAGLNFAGLIPAQLSTNITYPWGAPLYNFKLEQVSYDLSSPTQGKATVPLSFENHATFDLAGTIRVELYDKGDSFLGESQTAFNVPRFSPYRGSLEFAIPQKIGSSSAGRSGHLKVFFSTSLFEYGPLVIPYG